MFIIIWLYLPCVLCRRQIPMDVVEYDGCKGSYTNLHKAPESKHKNANRYITFGNQAARGVVFWNNISFNLL